jgi:hypothetical protein
MRPFVCSLLYGDYFDLHRRHLQGIVATVPEEVPIHFWCNQVGLRSMELLRSMSRPSWVVTESPENVPKYRAMGRMFERFRDAGSVWDWVLWLDDDTWFTTPYYWPYMTRFIEARKCENICYAGYAWWVVHLPGQWEFIQQSAWFRGRPPLTLGGKPAAVFASGGYWWLRTDVLRALDWPDGRLVHNGGDSLLGEAVRQQGLKLHHCHFGVQINDAARRGMSERPAGSALDVRR